MVKTIGLIYGRNENWIAGAYYIENLILALKASKANLPVLKIYSEKKEDFEALKKQTNYPTMSWVKIQVKNNFFDRCINKFSYFFFKTHWIVRGVDKDVDAIFPCSDYLYFEKFKVKIFWIPDFQEYHFPAFFTQKEIIKRKSTQAWLIEKKYPLVLSSESAKNDFEELYPGSKTPTFVMPFAVTLPDLSGIDIDTLRVKYNTGNGYFICPNQFWKHKNHKIVLQALINLKGAGVFIKILFTGKPYDNRNPDYFTELTKFIEENNLNDMAIILGFIDRKEQLTLIKHSLAVIQPSLFEGWSTVIEDSKSLNVPVIASNIPVHREQLPEEYPLFFNPEDSEDLSNKILSVLGGLKSEFLFSYNDSVKEFGLRFTSIVEQLI